MNFMSSQFSSKTLLSTVYDKLYACCISFFSEWYMYLCNQEIQVALANQMLACQDLLRHSQKCAGLMVSVKFSLITHLSDLK